MFKTGHSHESRNCGMRNDKNPDSSFKTEWNMNGMSIFEETSDSNIEKFSKVNKNNKSCF